MTRAFYLTGIGFFLFISNSFSQINLLRQEIENITTAKKAHIGVAVYGIETNDTLSFNGEEHFPMQSVFKFHIALAVLHQVDQGKLSLDQKIFIKKSELPAGTWSPLQKEYPEGNVTLSLRKILLYTVSQSDNNGCDILLRILGGPKFVNDYIHSIGIKDVSIKASEKEMHKAWNVQFSNWTTPICATKLLLKFYEGKILSQKSEDFLMQIMKGTSTGGKRIRGLLPPGTIVAHKTGTSDTNVEGITAAINDIGIVTLPGGKHFAISIFVSNSKENEEENEKIIANISKAAWDYFLTR